MLFESQVVDCVCSFLQRNEFRNIKSVLVTEHGEDITAIAPDRKTRVSIEAKGETSSNPKSPRYGKPFDSGQVWDHVSKAVYKAALHFSTGTLAAVAFPGNAAHIGCVKRILPALKRLEIEVFWVSADGEVDIEEHWKVWRRVKGRGQRPIIRPKRRSYPFASSPQTDDSKILGKRKPWLKYAGSINDGPPDLSSRRGYSRG